MGLKGRFMHTLESGINVGQGINVRPGKFVKNKKRGTLNKQKVQSYIKKPPIKLENTRRPWKKITIMLDWCKNELKICCPKFIQGPTFIFVAKFSRPYVYSLPYVYSGILQYFKKDLTPLYSSKIAALAGFNMQWYVQCSFPNMGNIRK